MPKFASYTETEQYLEARVSPMSERSIWKDIDAGMRLAVRAYCKAQKMKVRFRARGTRMFDHHRTDIRRQSECLYSNADTFTVYLK